MCVCVCYLCKCYFNLFISVIIYWPIVFSIDNVLSEILSFNIIPEVEFPIPESFKRFVDLCAGAYIHITKTHTHTNKQTLTQALYVSVWWKIAFPDLESWWIDHICGSTHTHTHKNKQAGGYSPSEHSEINDNTTSGWNKKRHEFVKWSQTEINYSTTSDCNPPYILWWFRCLAGEIIYPS